jgi:hypothetical protein
MSALPPKADIGTQPRNVRFVPKADIRLGPAESSLTERDALGALRVSVTGIGLLLTPPHARDLEECEESRVKKELRIFESGASTGLELLALLIAAIREAGLKRTPLVRVRATALCWRVHIHASVVHGSHASRCCSRSRLFNVSRLCCIPRRFKIVPRISGTGHCGICGTRYCGIAICTTGHR